MSSLPSASSASVRLQHLLPASLIVLLALTVTWLSYTREPSDAFLFPRLISSAMLLLASWNFIRALLGLAKVGTGISGATLLRILPGLCVMIALVYFAAKELGFYCASYLAFITLYSLYDPASHAAVSTWVKRLLVTTAFMAVIYGLFTVLLKVQTPRGLFF